MGVRLSLVTVAERLHGGPPPRCHDPELFVDPDRLRNAFVEHGIAMTLHGLRAAPLAYLRFVPTRHGRVPMWATSSLAGLYASVGVKQSVATTTAGERA